MKNKNRRQEALAAIAILNGNGKNSVSVPPVKAEEVVAHGCFSTDRKPFTPLNDTAKPTHPKQNIRCLGGKSDPVVSDKSVSCDITSNVTLHAPTT